MVQRESLWNSSISKLTHATLIDYASKLKIFDYLTTGDDGAIFKDLNNSWDPEVLHDENI